MRWILQMGAPGGAAQNETHKPFFSLTGKFILGGKGGFFFGNRDIRTPFIEQQGRPVFKKHIICNFVYISRISTR